MIINVISSTERVGKSIADVYRVGSSPEFTSCDRGLVDCRSCRQYFDLEKSSIEEYLIQ